MLKKCKLKSDKARVKYAKNHSKQSQANSFKVLWNVVEVGSLPPPHLYIGQCPCA